MTGVQTCALPICRRLFGDVTSGDIAEPETTVAEGKKPAARQAKAVAAAVAEKVNQESM